MCWEVYFITVLTSNLILFIACFGQVSKMTESLEKAEQEVSQLSKTLGVKEEELSALKEGNNNKSICNIDGFI